MTVLKFSRQRKSIQDYLLSTHCHPTADLIYDHVRREFPNISLATVYRNLNLLSELGEIIKISTPQGGDRFDGNVEPHHHFICKECGSIQDLDLEMIQVTENPNMSNFDGVIEGQSTTFYGKCKNCRE